MPYWNNYHVSDALYDQLKEKKVKPVLERSGVAELELKLREEHSTSYLRLGIGSIITVTGFGILFYHINLFAEGLHPQRFDSCSYQAIADAIVGALLLTKELNNFISARKLKKEIKRLEERIDEE